MKGGFLKLQRAAGFSKFILGILLPLCIWGLLASLVLYLIELRSLFIEGGEWRLRQGLLAFAFGIILIQRIARMLGKSLAWMYGIALGVAITLFALYMAHAYRLPASPVLVFLANKVLFLVLWFVGHHITAACWLDDPIKERTVADIGIFARIRMRSREKKEEPSKEEKEKKWLQPLPKSHPGRVILYFSLFAIPVFGGGMFLFDLTDPAVQLRIGLFLFLYLWCAFALLFLASLSQLTAYFEKRGVGLPEQVGVPWLSLGFVIVTLIVICAFFLPQPPSIPALYVRDKLVANYRGFSSSRGIREDIGKGGAQKQGQAGDLKSGKLDRQAASDILDNRYQGVDKLDDPYLSDVHRNTGIEPEYRNLLKLGAVGSEVFDKIFGAIVLIIYGLLILGGIVVVYILAVSFLSGFSQRWGAMRDKSAKKKIKPLLKKRKRKKPKGERPLLERFRRFSDPFRTGTAGKSGNALVRYLWEALLAFCADFGNPCEADKTPFEFVEKKPEALEGFEESALYIADIFTFSEYSGKHVSPEEIPRLKKFWADLQRHASFMS